jgi:hypothetical protein
VSPEEPAQEYHPELLSRRGELLAWFSALMVISAWIILDVDRQPVMCLVPWMAVLLTLIASGISLSNWMDRHTSIVLEPGAIKFTNGLRRVRVAWDDIRQVQVFPSAWGKKVRVIAAQVYFEFRTFGEIKVQGDVKGRTGFFDGELILQRILEAAHLHEIERTASGDYYARG